MNRSQRSGILPQMRNGYISILVIFFLAALGIRIYDLTDPPLDFHPTRQFFTAIIARGMYYQDLEEAPEWMRAQAVAYWKTEDIDFPTIHLLATWTYRLIGHEDIFYPRLYSIIFWNLGGLAVFLIGKELFSKDGGLVALAFYLFAPYGVIASRSFQPDPLMLCLILFAWWSMLRWMTTGRWRWSILAGLFSAAAMLTKPTDFFLLLGGMAGVFLANGFRKSLRDLSFWTMGIIAAVPVLTWAIYRSAQGTLGSLFNMRFFPKLWIDLLFYLRLEAQFETAVGLIPFILALLGLFLIEQKEKRIYLAGLWCGFALNILAFSYHFMTHDYYHIPLIPITALSLAPLGSAVIARLKNLNPGWLARTFITVVFIGGLGANLWNIRQLLHKEDHRSEAAMLEHIGEVLGPNISAIALTSDYGYPLFFYAWISTRYWPHAGDAYIRELAGLPASEFTAQFEQLIAGREYFVITDLAELEAQQELKQHLSSHFPVLDSGDGYMIYDLRETLDQP